MQPAYHISLTPTEKRIITEIGAIQSQIEWLMRLTVMNLLEVTAQTAAVIMGSTSIRSNAEIWIAVVREKHPYEECVEWAEWAFKQLDESSRARNDFLHTLYGFDGGDDVPRFLYGHLTTRRDMKAPRKAVRLKGERVVPLDQLKTIRDRAAYLSMAFAHVEEGAQPDADSSPWRHRLGSTLPPPNRWSRVRRATKRKAPPES